MSMLRVTHRIGRIAFLQLIVQAALLGCASTKPDIPRQPTANQIELGRLIEGFEALRKVDSASLNVTWSGYALNALNDKAASEWRAELSRQLKDSGVAMRESCDPSTCARIEGRVHVRTEGTEYLKLNSDCSKFSYHIGPGAPPRPPGRCLKTVLASARACGRIAITVADPILAERHTISIISSGSTLPPPRMYETAVFPEEKLFVTAYRNSDITGLFSEFLVQWRGAEGNIRAWLLSSKNSHKFAASKTEFSREFNRDFDLWRCTYRGTDSSATQRPPISSPKDADLAAQPQGDKCAGNADCAASMGTTCRGNFDCTGGLICWKGKCSEP